MPPLISKMGYCASSKLLLALGYLCIAIPFLQKPHLLGFIFILLGMSGVIATLISYQQSFAILKKYSLRLLPLKKRTEHLVISIASVFIALLLGTHPQTQGFSVLFCFVSLMCFILSIFVAKMDHSEETS